MTTATPVTTRAALGGRLRGAGLAAGLLVAAAARGGAQSPGMDFGAAGAAAAAVPIPTILTPCPDGRCVPPGGRSAALPFPQDPGATRRVNGVVEQSFARVNPRDAAAFAALVRSGRATDAFTRYLASAGLRADDLGDVAAGFLALQWAAAAGAGDPPAAALRALRQQVGAAVDARGGAAGLPNLGARQSLGEVFAHQGALIANARAQAARGDGALAARLRAAAAEGLRAGIGVDPGALRLGPAGFAVGAEAPDVVAAGPATPVRPPDGSTAASTAAVPLPAGRGVPVQRIVLSMGVVPDMINGGVQMRGVAKVLFANGWARSPFAADPGALDDAAIRAEAAGPRSRWSRWRAVAGGVEVRAAGERPDTIEVLHDALPATPGFRLDGYYWTRGGAVTEGALGTGMAFSSNEFVFRPDGTFTQQTGGGATAGGGSAGAYSQRGAAGRYALSGYTITLTYADGRTRRALFYRFPGDQGDDVIGIGAQEFYRGRGGSPGRRR